ncbi:uncharacterized protein LOC6567637 [Drosophila grimshawi]|uniref:GH23392 n=1 Tax=Drosophila grimshawi TaxID=7222 RepID=B4JT31_DROGR|nr:uncharacterized protein LOC6567637 [Drosophila grimshawi]EDV94921.1 GH23392 [Drosophila grimshawi]
MSDQEEEYTKYLNEHGIIPRLVDILKELVELVPLPADPLMVIMHVLGCPLIPQDEMKALERKVTRAHDELRFLRRVLVELGGLEYLYDSDTDESDYLGLIGEQYCGNYEETSSSTPMATPTSFPSPSPFVQQQQYVVLASLAINEEPLSPLEETLSPQEEQPCCSHFAPPNNVQQF